MFLNPVMDEAFPHDALEQKIDKKEAEKGTFCTMLFLRICYLSRMVFHTSHISRNENYYLKKVGIKRTQNMLLNEEEK